MWAGALIFPEEARNKTADAGKGTGTRNGTARPGQSSFVRVTRTFCATLPCHFLSGFLLSLQIISQLPVSAPPTYFPSATVIEHLSHCLTSLSRSHFLNRCPNYLVGSHCQSLSHGVLGSPEDPCSHSPLNLQVLFSCAWNALPLGSSYNL